MGRRRSRRDRTVDWLANLNRRFRAFISDPVRRFQVSLIFLLLFLVVGVGGYMLIERMPFDEALYMTIITVTTVGFGDVVPETDVGRTFTVVLIILGIGAATTAVSNAIEVIAGQRLWTSVRIRRMEEQLQVLNNHYVVAGYGRIGQQIVRDIQIRGEACVVVDHALGPHLEGMLFDMDIPFILGDATEDAVLIKAQVQRARGFVAALPSDADNVLAILTAREQREDVFIVARASEVTSESKLRRAGADHVISPYQVGAHRMAMALLRPAVHSFLKHLFDISDEESYDIGQIDVRKGSRLVGQSIMTSELRRIRNLSILAINTHDEELVINPNPQREFKVGDRLIVIGPPHEIYHLEEVHDTEEGA